MALNRRSFLKSSVGGAAGITLVGAGLKSAIAGMKQSGGWTDKKPINPDIDNMRVVCMHDPDMCSDPGSTNFSRVNAAVDTDKVSENMDKMAMALVGKTSAEEAWKTIFRSGKEWKDTKAIIKVNSANARNMPRAAVVKKIADVLGGFGVPKENITVFDGHGNAGANGKYVASEVNAQVSNKFDGVGGVADVQIPGVSGVIGPKDLVDGTTDIIVNVAVHRGHNLAWNGNVTLCLKNHYGTFLDKQSLMATPLHDAASFVNVNKHELIVGGDPVRQQLCIVDSLWGAKDGPFESGPTPDGDYNRLVMGTFAGAVDYYTVKEIREKMNNWSHNDTIIAKFLTDYGYDESDIQAVDITPDTVTVRKVNPSPSTNAFTFTLTGSAMRRSSLQFELPLGDKGDITVSVLDMRGSLVRVLKCRAGTAMLQWDGKASNRRPVPTGTYIVYVSAGSVKQSQQVIVTR